MLNYNFEYYFQIIYINYPINPLIFNDNNYLHVN